MLTNKIFSKQILSCNGVLKRGLVWEFIGWKLIILSAFLVKSQFANFLNSATILSRDKTAVGWVEVKNNKIDGS